MHVQWKPIAPDGLDHQDTPIYPCVIDSRIEYQATLTRSIVTWIEYRPFLTESIASRIESITSWLSLLNLENTIWIWSLMGSTHSFIKNKRRKSGLYWRIHPLHLLTFQFLWRSYHWDISPFKYSETSLKGELFDSYVGNNWSCQHYLYFKSCF